MRVVAVLDALAPTGCTVTIDSSTDPATTPPKLTNRRPEAGGSRSPTNSQL
jgi:hypothetical protein